MTDKLCRNIQKTKTAAVCRAADGQTMKWPGGKSGESFVESEVLVRSERAVGQQCVLRTM